VVEVFMSRLCVENGKAGGDSEERVRVCERRSVVWTVTWAEVG
jgi:hypothetical protein